MQYQKISTSSSHGFNTSEEETSNPIQDAKKVSSPSTAISSPFSIDSGLEDNIISDIEEDHSRYEEGWTAKLRVTSSLCSWSRLTFSWIRPLLELGNRRPLLPDDLGKLEYEDESTSMYTSFKRSWENPVNKRSLPMVLCEAYGFPFFMAGLLKLVHDSCLFVGKVYRLMDI